MLSRVVCYVCGSLGGVCSLHVHARDNGPYFPFLENHDPPKGARLPNSNGVIDSCRVCYSFLLQQWDSYERTKTPPVKRLYWLKRVDNGTFTGAEMRIQGEYAAQVMGLQYQPSGSGTLSPYDYAGIVSGPNSGGSRKGVISPGGSSYISSQAGYEDRVTNTEGDEVLDLSVTNSKPDSKCAPLRNLENSEVASKRKQTPPEPSPKLEGSTIVCYVCAKEYPSSLGRFIYAMKHGDDEPYFPFFYNIPPPKGCMILTKNGLTKACSGCRKTLCRQWRYFESNEVPEDQRVYQIDDKPVPYQSVAGGMVGIHNPRLQTRPDAHHNHSSAEHEACYLCAHALTKDNMEMVQTIDPQKKGGKYNMYFPFIAKLHRPKGARPIDKGGNIISCRKCYINLHHQWQTYETEAVPIKHRKFVLRDHEFAKEHQPVKSAPRPGSTEPKTPSQPLNIQIGSQASSRASPMSIAGHPPSGLLAIAPSGQTPMIMSGMSYLYPQLTGSLSAPIVSDVRQSHKDRTQKKSSTNHDSSRITSATQETKCVVCGVMTNKPKSLQAHPLKREPGEKSGMGPTWPFFPFLTNPSYGGLASIAKDGTVMCCFPCYHSLHQQWVIFEGSDNIEEQNRWLRKYKTKIFTCYTCGKDTKRQAISEVHLTDYPFMKDLLQELPRLKQAIHVDSEGVVVICIGCRTRLDNHYRQMKEDDEAHRKVRFVTSYFLS